MSIDMEYRTNENIIKLVGGETQSFDQGALGHEAKKKTTIWTDLPVNVDGIRRYGKKKDKNLSAEKLARWAPGLRRMVNEALIQKDEELENIIKRENRSRNTDIFLPRSINRFRVSGKSPQIFYDEGAKKAKAAGKEQPICEVVEGEKLDPLKLSNGELFWNQHCRGGHLLYNSQCFHCVHGALRGRPHRRVKDEARDLGSERV